MAILYPLFLIQLSNVFRVEFQWLKIFHPILVCHKNEKVADCCYGDFVAEVLAISRLLTALYLFNFCRSHDYVPSHPYTQHAFSCEQSLPSFWEEILCQNSIGIASLPRMSMSMLLKQLVIKCQKSPYPEIAF